MRNKLFMHTIKDDSVLGGLKFVSKHEDSQVYCKTIPNAMVSREIMETMTYKTYLAFSTGKAIPKKARKRTKIATTPKKKSSLTADDNIISEDPDAALELAKSISRTEAEEQEAVRLVHETHECLVTEKSTRIRKQTCVIFKDTLTVSKKKPLDQSQKHKGVQVMSVKEQVPDELTVGTGAHDDSKDSWGTESDIEKSDEQKIKEGDVPWIYSDDDEEDDNDDDQSIDIEETDDDECTESDNKDQAMNDAEKNDEDKFLISSPEHSLLAPLLDVLASVIPRTPTTPTPPSIPTTTITTTEAPASTFVNPKFKTLSALHLRVSDLEKEVKELKQADHSTTLRASIRSEVPSAINKYLGLSLGDAFRKELQKHTEELRQEYSQKYQDPPAGPDQGLKKRKTSKDVEPYKKPKSTVFEAEDTDMPLNQGDNLGNTDEQPNVKAASKHDWFQKPQRAPTPNTEWNKGKSVNNEPPENWLNDLANAKKTSSFL
ncbi:hypothetical protein Tco_0943952 [Tanacetum coccineum]